MVTNAMPIQPGLAISAQAMLGKFGTFNTGTIRLVVYWYSDTAGLTVVSQAGNKSWESGISIAGQNVAGRWVDLPNLIAPSGIQSFRIGIWTDNVTGNGVYTEAGAWMLKAEYGSTCTAWTDDALPLEIDARIRTEEGTRASADSALAIRATTLEATVNDGTTGVAATAARLTTEEGTRATADSALASRSTTLEAVARTRGDSILPDPNMRDISWWANGVSGVQLIDDSTGWARSRLMQIARNGDFDFSTPFFPVQLGATYRVRVRIWNNSAGWTGAFWPLIHIPSYAWYSLKHGNPVNPDIADAGNAIIANGDTLELEWTITNTAASANANREWQFRFKGQGVSSASPIFLNVEIIQLTGWTETQTNLARIITEESTRASADSALASRTDVVEAVVSVGSPSANLVPNSFLVNLDGYEWTSAGTGPFNRGLNLGGWSSATNPTGYIQVARVTAVGSETVIDERSPRFRVSPSQNYGFAARLAPHRATASIRLEFLDASGAFINNTSLITGGTEGGGGNGVPSTFTTVGGFTTSPSNAVFGRVVVRLAGNGQGDPYVFWQAMDCFKASQGQTTLRPYQDGVPLDRTARIEAEESARASGDAANALSIQTVSARVDGRPNLFPYPQPISNRTPTQQGWSGTEVSALFSGNLGGMVYYRARSGGSAVTEYYYFNLPDTYYIDANNQYTLSANGYAGASSNTNGDRLFMYIEVLSADLSTILYGTPGVNLNSSTTRYTQTTNYTGTPVSGRLRVVFAREWAASGSYQDVVFSNIKLEAGTLATAFTNTAQVQVSAQAIATLNDSAAFYQILVAASGGDPALIRLFSGLGGSEVALAAKIISLVNTDSGVAMPVMRAQGGEAYFQRPISSDFGGRRLTIGPGYGVSGQQIVLWFGPDTLAPAAQSRTNGYFSLGTDGAIYYGANNLLDAVSTYFTATISGNVSIPHDTWTSVIEVEVDPIPAGSRVLISPTCLVDPVDGVESYIDVRLVDINTSTVLRLYSNMLKPIFSGGAYRAVADALVSFSFTTEQLATGATYQLQVKSRTPTNTSLVANVKTRDISVLVLKN